METTSVNQFRDNLKRYVERAIDTHTPLKVTRRSGEDFVVISAEDWERERETLYVLQNQNLMQQIARSSVTHANDSGYSPNANQLGEWIS